MQPVKMIGKPLGYPSGEKTCAREAARDQRQRACTLWEEARQGLAAETDTTRYGAWISLVIPISDDGKTLRLAVPTGMARTNIMKNYGKAIEKRTCRRVVIEVNPSACESSAQASPPGARGCG